MSWLEREHPHLVGRYQRMYSGGVNAPAEYKKWLAAKIHPLLAAHGLQMMETDPATGGTRSSTLHGPHGRRRSNRALEVNETRAAAVSQMLAEPTLF